MFSSAPFERNHSGVFGALHSVRKRIERWSPFYRRNFITTGRAGNLLMRGLLSLARPVFLGRLGSTEAACLSFYLRHRPARPYPNWLVHELSYSSGMFSHQPEQIDRFARLLMSALEKTDLLAVWNPSGEAHCLPRCCPQQPALVPLHCLRSWTFGDPWSELLENRKVAVIHPFRRSIEENYRQRRTLLFHNQRVLPQFELSVVEAVQGLTGEETGFPDWFSALEFLKSQLQAVEYDTAIVGCGAYGLPLSAWIRGQGKSVIHMAGKTQLLFGIMGRRWSGQLEPWARIEHWTRPRPEETPSDFLGMESGCYW